MLPPRPSRRGLRAATLMSDAVEVAIVGAGPYGLSLAAHLRAAGVSVRQFGLPMQLWRAFMPEGMFLKSQGFASNLSDPEGTHTLEAFCRATGRPYASYGLPVPLDTFVAYGQWFRTSSSPTSRRCWSPTWRSRDGGFELTLANSERLRARTVVVAIGVEHFAHVPAPLSALPSAVCTHSSAHTDLAAFRGQEVVVVGAGQSALESAALLHENGARASRLVARKDKTSPGTARRWPSDRPLLQRLQGAGVRARLGLGHLVLLQPPGLVPAPAAVHPGVPGAHRARPGRGQLAARPGGGAVPRPDRPRRSRRPGCRTAAASAWGSPGPTDHPRAGRRPRDRGHRLPHRPAPRLRFLGEPDPVRPADRARHRQLGRRRATTSPPSPACTSSVPPWPRPWGRSCASCSAPSTPPPRWHGSWPAPPRPAAPGRPWQQAGNDS